MKLLLSGPPGTGKTFLGNWLSRELSYYHLDMEAWPEDFPKTIWDEGRIEDFVHSLDSVGKDIVLSWGFPPQCLSLVQRMVAAGVAAIWLDAPVLFCRAHWKPNPDQQDSTFYEQLRDICKAGVELSDFYRGRIVSVSSLEQTFLNESQVFEAVIRSISSEPASGPNPCPFGTFGTVPADPLRGQEQCRKQAGIGHWERWKN